MSADPSKVPNHSTKDIRTKVEVVAPQVTRFQESPTLGSRNLASAPIITREEFCDLSYPSSVGPNIVKALDEASIRVRFEFFRLASHYQYPLRELDLERVRGFEDYWNLWNYFKNSASLTSVPPPTKIDHRAWEAAGEGSAEVSLRGKLEFNSEGEDPPMRLCLDSLRTGKSCRFLRSHGAHNFVYISVPNIANTAKRETLIVPRFRKWLKEDKTFLGRKWAVMYTKKKDRKPGQFELGAEKKGLLVILYAIENEQGQSMKKPATRSACQASSIDEVVNWFLPLEKNAQLPHCKAYSRLALGLSKSVPTVTFRPSQIREIPDILADGSAESTEFMEEGEELKERFDLSKPEVMNDGCSVLSPAAAQRISKHLGLNGRSPSVYQGRMGCWKGLWAVAKGGSDSDIWIQVTPSQKKFEQHDDDHDDQKRDPFRTTFDVVNFSKPATPAKLSPTLIPILIDRKVAEEDLHCLFRSAIERERDCLLEAAQSPYELYRWLHATSPTPDEVAGDTEGSHLGSMPRFRATVALQLLEQKFLPNQLPYLAKVIQDLMDEYLQQYATHLRPCVGLSTNLFAVADPMGCLRPGEVHLMLSETFFDNQPGYFGSMLFNTNAIISRPPALRASDVQKVRIVVKPELSHLIDVLVFPTKGVFPLAKRLQNGDYDGDTYWVFWDPRLVDRFKNKASPPGLPDPTSLGMTVDERKLSSMTSYANEAKVRPFLHANFDKQSQDHALGLCTKAYEKLVYTTGTLDSEGVEYLANLHDLLVDAPKLGYSYTTKRFFPSLKQMTGLNYKELQTPVLEKIKNGGEIDKALVPRRSATDRLLLDTVQPAVNEVQMRMRNLWQPEAEHDEALCRPFWTARSQSDQRQDREVDQLKERIERLRETWTQGFRQNGKSSNDSFTHIDRCYGEFQNIAPTTDAWSEQQRVDSEISGAPTQWDLLKASTVYRLYPDDAFTFRMAGTELGFLKAWSTGGACTISQSFRNSLKLKRQKGGWT
ncbi:MAG: hypothetical protein LQ339_007768 [Xanthoria mediterranea]|nr:MAG: hypothetical protein LQ339_007768 [Xanthoria mediterranea]